MVFDRIRGEIFIENVGARHTGVRLRFLWQNLRRIRGEKMTAFSPGVEYTLRQGVSG